MSQKDQINYPIDNPYTLDSADVAAKLQTNTQDGLSDATAKQRTELFGINGLKAQKQKSVFLIAFEQFKSPIVLLLVVASAVSFVFEHWLEGYSIIGVIFITAAIGFFMELQARISINTLRAMDVILAKVLRDKAIKEIPSEQIAIGEVVLLEAGDIVPADGRLFEVNQLEIDESALTGESLPVSKDIATLGAQAQLGDQHNMVFKGTAVVKGNGKVLITSIGAETELGKVSALVDSADSEATPLEKKLQNLTKKLIWVTSIFAGIFVVTGLIQGKEIFMIFETAIALAVAAIPEGLPIVATIALTYGMLRMAKKNVLIKRLASVETLGGTNVVFTDKTGTLTENKIEVETLSFVGKDVSIKSQNEVGTTLKNDLSEDYNFPLDKLINICVLCNNAEIRSSDVDERQVGDPIEIAMLQFVSSYGTDIESLKNAYPRVAEIAFSSETKIMGTLHEHEGAFFVAAKGAVEELILKCSRYCVGNQIQTLDDVKKGEFLAKAEELQSQGLRALAFAYNDNAQNLDQEDFIKDLIFVASIGFLDPPRLDVVEALRSCREAGVKVIMITGDHPATALNIAQKVQLSDHNVVMGGKELEESSEDPKLFDVNIFARVNPKQKLDMVAMYQKRGDIVAMTGDGINDAPAIKKADIGIAMGIRGTAVAKETADVILKQDSFTAIVSAIEQGRAIFQNIKRFMVYLLSCNLSEILIVFVLGLFSFSFSLLPLQILFLNILTDIFPALALGMGKGDSQSMKNPPRNPEEPVLVKKDWTSIIIYSSVMTLSVLIVTWYSSAVLHFDAKQCNNIAFLGLAFAQLWHVFNLPSYKISFLDNEVTRNAYIWYALLVCSAIIVIFCFVPTLREIVGLQSLSLNSWFLIGIISVIPIPIVQIIKRIFKFIE